MVGLVFVFCCMDGWMDGFIIESQRGEKKQGDH